MDQIPCLFHVVFDFRGLLRGDPRGVPPVAKPLVDRLPGQVDPDGLEVKPGG